jgi:AcrR family transcriptional regulator
MADTKHGPAVAAPQNARSRRTRAAILAATRSVLEEAGFEGLTMAAVAERAGVTRRALYLHFSSRTELVASLFDHIAAEEGLADLTAAVWEAPTARVALERWASFLALYHPRLIAVTRAVEAVRDHDPDAQAHWRRVTNAQHANCRRLAKWLADEGALAEPWTAQSAAEMLWALISTDLIERLLRERRWSKPRLASALSIVFQRTFVRGEGAATSTTRGDDGP